ncbi:hypothetical protein ACF09H_32000 [Streptomyces sp. NPDC014983]|uniref:hypothetical protein n=1 Tax=Streptomyces sp. NPDC014983 TaxID=3364933 RepID=UPI003701FC2A
MSTGYENEDATTVEVNVHALVLQGDTTLSDLREGTVIRLEEDALGISSGWWRVGCTYSNGGGGHRYRCRALTAVAGPCEDAVSARVADGWASPWPVEVKGMRLAELRARLAELADVDGDALVVIAPADHNPDGGEYSPASYVHTGLYVPDFTGRGSVGGLYEMQPRNPADAAPAGALPAVAIYPSA